MFADILSKKLKQQRRSECDAIRDVVVHIYRQERMRGSETEDPKQPFRIRGIEKSPVAATCVTNY